ncbi:transcription factor RelB isoform X4 [Trachemys scripta elegans]|uniref:transcription factor RelB isoform X4 n=1 Tax=Trachemys scripta elegans TaxID=31138 RepID=UPI0015520671|nr:transcription factor RelB isoform X4 [Trachemys scripta elegans]
MRDTRGRQPRPEELALPRGEGMRGAARPDPGLVMAHTAQASGKGAAISDEDELEIIEELIKEDGFQPQAPPFLSKASPKGTAKLVPRGSNPAGPTGMLRLMEPTGPSPLPVGLTSFGSSHPAAAHALPLDSQPPLLSQSLSSLQLTPRLVPRGTTPPPASRPHWASPMRSPKEQLEDMLEPPRLVITEQPKQRGMRFRYECEGRSAGSILGESSTEASKTLPAIELLNCQKIPEVKVIACLVWKDWPYRIHPHSLVGKDCNNGLCEVTLRPQVNPKHRSRAWILSQRETVIPQQDVIADILENPSYQPARPLLCLHRDLSHIRARGFIPGTFTQITQPLSICGCTTRGLTTVLSAPGSRHPRSVSSLTTTFRSHWRTEGPELRRVQADIHTGAGNGSQSATPPIWLNSSMGTQKGARHWCLSAGSAWFQLQDFPKAARQASIPPHPSI